MKIEVKRTIDRKYVLFIYGEEIMESEYLSDVVDKIAQYLKMRFLKESEIKKGGVAGFLERFKDK